MVRPTVAVCSGAPAPQRWGRPGRILAAATLAVAVSVAGCSAAQEPSSTLEVETENKTHNRVDVMFAQMMIPHHDDAIAMAQYLGELDGVDPTVDELATQIMQAQRSENREMNAWLRQHGYQQVPSTPGQVDVAALAGASRPEVERAFLTEMVAHHEHGVDMARGAAARGDSPAMTRLAEDMAEDQTREIELMQDLLARS